MKNLFNAIAFFFLVSGTPLFADWMCEISCRGPCLRGTISESGSSRSSALSNATESCKTSIAESGCPGNAEVSVNSCYERGGPPSGSSHYQLIFKNNCSKHGKIYTAINRRDLDGTWTKEGFWGLEYGETARVGTTTNRKFYAHAHNSSGVTWGSGSGPWNIRGQEYPFSIHEIAEGRAYGEYVYNFNCN